MTVVKTGSGDEAFVFGFLWAQRRFSEGLTVETLVSLAQATHTLEYQAGAEAWADLHMGRTNTAQARRATELGLEVIP